MRLSTVIGFIHRPLGYGRLVRAKSTCNLDARQIANGVGRAKGSRDEKARYKLENECLSGLPDRSKPFTVMGIESSCDDTGVAIVRSDGSILSNIVLSQHKIHESFGGIVPTLAMEAHKSNIDVAIAQALDAAGMASLDDLDAIAVTKGPGLEICLRIGLHKAQSIAAAHTLPIVMVHHLEAHCVVARLAGLDVKQTDSAKPLEYPFLALLVSGGHTSLLICNDLGQYDLLGGALDDALGEAFDKSARILGLRSASSGGVAVEAMAKVFKEKYSTSLLQHSMSVPMRNQGNCDFSYAGLKNSFRLEVQKARAAHGDELSEEWMSFLCHSFQDIAFSHLEDRVKRALKKLRSKPLTALVVVGGVAANQELRRRLQMLLEKDAAGVNKKPGNNQPVMRLVCPPPALCTDNGVMVAWAGIEKLKRGISNAHEVDQEPKPRWPMGTPFVDSAPAASIDTQGLQ